jgi:hypothetical protein
VNVYEYRVIVSTTDERDDAADRIEREVVRALGNSFGEHVYIEQAVKPSSGPCMNPGCGCDSRMAAKR